MGLDSKTSGKDIGIITHDNLDLLRGLKKSPTTIILDPAIDGESLCALMNKVREIHPDSIMDHRGGIFN